MDKTGDKVYIDTNEARDMVKNKMLNKERPSLPTIISWTKKHKLGFKLAGRWKIDKEKFIMFLSNRISHE